MIRNLIYHITPTGNWLWNLNLLKPYLPIFNGKKIAAIVEGRGLLNFEIVQKHLPGFKLLSMPNSKSLRETITLEPLLREVLSLDPEEITFYGHTKGVTHYDNPAVNLWTEHCYKLNLEEPELIEAWLRDFPVVGSFKRHGKLPHFPKESEWHYSGTFYWFRNRNLFSKKWKNIPKMKYGAEAYPSMFFKNHEAKCLYYDNVKDLYDLKYIKNLLGVK